jgi:subtilisin family serine protease
MGEDPGQRRRKMSADEIGLLVALVLLLVVVAITLATLALLLTRPGEPLADSTSDARSTSIGSAAAAAGSWAVVARADGMDALRAQLRRAAVLVPGRVLLVSGERPRVRGARYVVNVESAHRSLQFDNTEPDAAEQWYLTQDNAWSYWPVTPALATVKVAVVDSGIDAGHPEFTGRIAAGVSFVGSSWRTDSCGHGTFVAGEIAANPHNGFGIAGLAFNARLLIAKVVDSSCKVSTLGEIHGIVWAVDHGARVVNLSLGGLRDPQDPSLDSFSAPELAAVEYAWSKDVLVVAAAGNGTQAPSTPWNYADYPAALPHVLGVAAVRQDGSVPDYSNRDARYVDLAAPGGPIFSTIPRNLVDASIPSCAGNPFSNCSRSAEFDNAIGTSFASPQVTAAGALLLGADPTLTASQVEWLLERSATDANPSTGCPVCPVGRDALTGWGTLNIAAALERLARPRGLPAMDPYEPNDQAGRFAHPFGSPRTLQATLDYWDDPIDVYSLPLEKGDQLHARLSRGSPAPNVLLLWRPGTQRVRGEPAYNGEPPTASSTSVQGEQRLVYQPAQSGTYYLEVEAVAGSFQPDRYQLAVAITQPAPRNHRWP